MGNKTPFPIRAKTERYLQRKGEWDMQSNLLGEKKARKRQCGTPFLPTCCSLCLFRRDSQAGVEILSVDFGFCCEVKARQGWPRDWGGVGLVPNPQLRGWWSSRGRRLGSWLCPTPFLHLGGAESPCQLQGGREAPSLGMDRGFGEAAHRRPAGSWVGPRTWAPLLLYCRAEQKP